MHHGVGGVEEGRVDLLDAAVDDDRQVLRHPLLRHETRPAHDRRRRRLTEVDLKMRKKSSFEKEKKDDEETC